MAFTMPRPPVLRESSLKATTRVYLTGHGLRRRAVASTEPLKVTLTPWSPTLHGGSFLLHLWVLAVQSKEHVTVFGPQAETVESFVRSYQQTEIVALHLTESDTWMTGEGLLAVAFLDDVDSPARARVHHFVLPAYRTPIMTQGLGTLTLHYYFEQRGLYTLYGLTPASNRAALRFAYRLGFTKYGVKPMVYEGQMVDGIETVLTRDRFLARRVLED